MPTGYLSPPLTHESSPMAKPNTKKLALAALPSASTLSSTCFNVPSLIEARVSIGSSANGSKSEFADSPPLERGSSHRHASSSLHRAFSWLHYLPAFLENQDLPSTPLRLKVPHYTLKQIVGKGRHTVARIQDHCGPFISISEYDTNFGIVQIWGNQCELAKVVVLFLSFGFYSTLDIISKNVIMRLLDP